MTAVMRRNFGMALGARRMCSVVDRRGTFEVINPTNKKVIATIPEDSASNIQKKFDILVAGQKKWKDASLEHRKECLLKFGELLELKKANLARILTSEMGKPAAQAKSEIRATVDRINYFLQNVEKVVSEETVLETSRLKEKLIYEPLGVVANISAWNYPYFISTNVIAAALLTGNSVLYKPSEYASLTGQEITDLLHKAGIPKDVFIIATGGASTGAKIASLDGLGGLFFTGSQKTGGEVAKRAALNLVKVNLELGGKDPVYVRHDVPSIPVAAATIADGAFYNCGQSCCSVERVYVDKRIFHTFVDQFNRKVKTFKVGDPMEPDTYIGPVSRKEHLSYLSEQLTDALNKGAKSEIGGDLRSSKASKNQAHRTGFYFPPTVLRDVDHSMLVMREETFGPLVGIQAVEDDAEALELMRDTKYGLTAGVFCKNSADAEALISELDVGTGYWNCCDRVSPRLPWSGRKASGIGATLGLDGLRAFVQPKGFILQQPSDS